MVSRRKSKNRQDTAYEQEFNVGDVVGATIKGYSLWPAKIINIDAKQKGLKKYEVEFFGDHQTSTSVLKMKLFSDYTEKEKNPLRRDLKEALRECKEYYDSLNKEENNNRAKDDAFVANEGASPCPSMEDELMIAEPDLKSDIKPLSHSKSYQLTEKIQENKSDDSDTPDQNLDHDPTINSKQAKQENGNQFANRSKNSLSKDSLTTNSLKPEGENTLRKVSRQAAALAKLREKVEKKLKEKEQRKRKSKILKFSTKASPKLEVIKAGLDSARCVLEGISDKTPLNSYDLRTIESGVKKYDMALEKLDRYVGYITKNDENDCRRMQLSCKDAVIHIYGILNAKKKYESIPSDLKKLFRQSVHKARKFKNLKDIIPRKKNSGPAKAGLTETPTNT